MPFPPLGPLPAGGTVHLDRGYDYQAVRDELAARGLHGRIAERHKPVVEFYLALASAIVTLGRLIRQAWSCYRWQTRPRRRP
jgi:hypothetical protein